MKESTRLKDMLKYLKDSNVIRNQQQFVEMVKSDKSTISLIKNGKVGISNSLFENIKKAFPQINPNWILTGEGNMLVGDVNGNNNAIGHHASVNVNQDELLSKALDQMSSQQKTIEKSQEQIDRLLSVIEDLTSKIK